MELAEKVYRFYQKAIGGNGWEYISDYERGVWVNIVYLILPPLAEVEVKKDDVDILIEEANKIYRGIINKDLFLDVWTAFIYLTYLGDE